MRSRRRRRRRKRRKVRAWLRDSTPTSVTDVRSFDARSLAMHTRRPWGHARLIRDERPVTFYSNSGPFGERTFPRSCSGGNGAIEEKYKAPTRDRYFALCIVAVQAILNLLGLVGADKNLSSILFFLSVRCNLHRNNFYSETIR